MPGPAGGKVRSNYRIYSTEVQIKAVCLSIINQSFRVIIFNTSLY